jgi:hypothetical protein
MEEIIADLNETLQRKCEQLQIFLTTRHNQTFYEDATYSNPDWHNEDQWILCLYDLRIMKCVATVEFEPSGEINTKTAPTYRRLGYSKLLISAAILVYPAIEEMVRSNEILREEDKGLLIINPSANYAITGKTLKNHFHSRQEIDTNDREERDNAQDVFDATVDSITVCYPEVLGGNNTRKSKRRRLSMKMKLKRNSVRKKKLY